MMMPRGLEGVRWRRGYAPVVVLLALAADYLSPAAMWTAALPLMFMAVLLTFRERRAALAVLFLSSWIAIPLSVGAVRAFDTARGQHRLFAVGGEVPGVGPRLWSQCNAPDLVTSELPSLDVVPEFAGHVIRTFASMHNSLALLSFDPYAHGGDCFGRLPENSREPGAE
jgi:hypothetical protein